MDIGQRARSIYQQVYGRQPSMLVRSPGRVNLIGDHTDYNDGFVLPMAIDRAIWLALEPTDDGVVRLYSADMLESRELALERLGHPGGGQERGSQGSGGAGGAGGAASSSPPHGEHEGWLEYIKGVAWALGDAGLALRGYRGVLIGDVPVGAGLSSSAALELAVARAFLAVAGHPYDPVQVAKLAQRAECEWVGTRCGIMDQLICAAGQAGQALLIDCRSLRCEPVPLPAGTAMVVLDTGTRRGLVGSAYNQRRAQCESAARALGVTALRDATMAMLEAHVSALEPVVMQRARHVIAENQRTLDAAGAMGRGDAEALGALMDGSHASLRDDFEVSTPALDRMVAIARSQPGCLGARMTGAGFGGCAVALIRAQAAAHFGPAVMSAYLAATGNRAVVHVCTAEDGAAVVDAAR